MSTTIDEKVVEMRFDNAQFERNVSQSMSTLDKLKAKLNFKDSSKGLEELQHVSSKMDFSTLNGSIETVKNSFSAMEVIGITALANITNSAVNAGKQLVKSLSIDQVTSGWRKGEEKIASIQTLVNSTGKSLDEIEDYLSQLMWYSDETSYSFTEMVSSLASMTSSGGDIDKLIPTIMGIANSTAYAGKGAAEFSRVIYNLQQSYGQGYLSAIDWKSVQQAGVASEALVKVLIEEGKKAGTIAEDLAISVGEFPQTLKDKWVTSEVMEKAFGRLAEFSLAVKEMVDSGEVSTAAEAIDILRDSYDELTVKMFTSAQEAKSFSEAINATKDAVSSGWMTTFEKIFGNYEETKAFWTEVTNSLWDIFASGAEARNDAIEEVMTNNGALDTLKKTLASTGHSMDDYEKALRSVAARQNINGKTINVLMDEYGSLENVITKVGIPVKYLKEAFEKLTGSEGQIATVTQEAAVSLEEMRSLVNAVIRGDWGNGQERVNRLTEAGYSYAATQFLVNKNWDRTNHTWQGVEVTAEDLAEAIKLMTDEQKKNMGMTDDQIKTFDELVDKMSEGKMTADEMWAALEKPTGRALLTGSITNVLEAVSTFVTVIKTAWGEVFGGVNTGAIYNTIEALNNFTKALILDGVEEEDGEVVLTSQARKFADALHVVFGAIKVVTSIVTGAFKAAWTIVKNVFKGVSTIVKAFIDMLPKGVSKFKDWITNGENIANLFDKIGTVVNKVVDFVVKLVKSFLEWEPIRVLVSKIYDLFVSIKDVLRGIFDPITNEDGWTVALSFQEIASRIGEVLGNIVKAIADNAVEIASAIWEVGKQLVLGLIQGIKDNKDAIWDFVSGIFNGIIDFIKSIFGIHSPSLVMMAIGGMLIAGLVAGLTVGWDNIWQAIKDLGKKFIENIGPVISWVTEFIITGLQSLKDGINNIIEWVKENLPGLANFFSDLTFGKAVGAGLGIGGLVELIKLGDTFRNFSSIPESIADITDAFRKMMKAAKFNLFTIGIKNLATALLLLAIAVAILVGSLWALAMIPASSLEQNLKTLGRIIQNIIFAVASLMGLNKLLGGGLTGSISKSGADFSKKGSGIFGALIGFAIAIVAFALAMKIVSTIDEKDLWRSFAVMEAIILTMVGALATFMLLAKGIPEKSKAIKQVGSTMLKMAIALLLMVIVCKLIAKLKAKEIAGGIIAMGLLVAFMLGMNMTTKYMKHDPSIGLLKAVIALGIMVLIFKLAGTLKLKDMVNGVVVMLAFLQFIILFGAISKVFPDMASMTGLLLSLGVCILLLSVSVKILSSIEPGKAFVGIAALVALMAAITGMLWGIKAAFKGTTELPKLFAIIMGLTVMLIAMTVCVAILSVLDAAGVAQGVVAIAALAAIMAGLLAMVVMILHETGGQKVEGVMGVIIALTAAVVAMTACLLIINLLSEEQVKRGTLVLAALMAMFALMLAAVALIVKFAGSSVKGVMAVIIVLTVFIAAIAVLLMVLSQAVQDPEKLKLMALALVAVLATLALVMIAAVAVGAEAALAIIGLGVMVIALGAFWACALLIKRINPEGLLPPIQALETLVTNMLPIMLMLASFAILGPLAAVGIVALDVVLALLIGSMTTLAGIVGFIEGTFGDGSAIRIINYIGDVLNALGEAIGKGISGFVLGLTNDLEEIGERISSFVDKITPGLEKVSGFGPELVEGAQNLLGFFVNLTGSKIMNAIGDLLGTDTDKLGADMAKFGNAIRGFYFAMKDIDFNVVDLATHVGEKLVELLNMIEPNKGLFTIFKNVDMDDFKADAKAFGEALSAYITALGPAIAMGLPALLAAEIMGLVASGMVTNMKDLDGYRSKKSSIEKFRDDMQIFVPAMADIMDHLKLKSAVLTSTVGAKALTSLTETLVELEKGLPRRGGIIDAWFGKDDIGKFGARMTEFAKGVCLFAQVIVDKGANLDNNLVNKAIYVAKTLGAIESNLPTNTNMVASWFGKDVAVFSSSGGDIGEFGIRLGTLANGICGFADKIANHGQNLDNGLVTKAVTVAKVLAALESSLPDKQTGIKTWFSNTEEGTFDDFGHALGVLAQGILDFSDSLGDADYSNVMLWIPKIERMIALLNTIGSVCARNNINDIFQVINGVGVLGEKIKHFADETNGLDTTSFDAGMSALSSISNVVGDLTTGKAQAFSFMADGMSKLATAGVDTFVSSVDNIENLNKIIDEANKLVHAFVDELSSDVMMSYIEDVGNEQADMYVDAVGLQTHVSDAQTKGNQLAQGYINGLKSEGKLKSAYNAGRSLAKKALQGIADGQASKSPSREGIKYGNYLGEGFVIGIDAYSSNVYSSASDLGTTAVNSLGNAIASAREMLDQNIDSQPTIRPVLDLSEIQAGAGQIGSLLNASPYIFGGSSTAQSISRSFIGQNGRNYDVVSALDRLGSDIVNNSSGDSYVINGVTYEEGSDVAAAIQTLAHAAVISGRR